MPEGTCRVCNQPTKNPAATIHKPCMELEKVKCQEKAKEGSKPAGQPAAATPATKAPVPVGDPARLQKEAEAKSEAPNAFASLAASMPSDTELSMMIRKSGSSGIKPDAPPDAKKHKKDEAAEKRLQETMKRIRELNAVQAKFPS
eukprot:NODE_9981_length_615_cov_42.648374_g9711_i0.p1 GENE.NODE_9981_length_615_cov_42.648374_g9711_i0~~NODE_9981_length_615_cov_42.648374_g9711_i0.p1  ORF type:complete len:145 (+),score=23.99 NODE_9981_length_615_cov_42.648374_g9711_i0:74-508(+)